MDSPHIDLLSILIAAIVNMIIGVVWYSRFLFGRHVEEETGPKPGKLAFLWSFITAIITAYILDIFIAFLGVTTVTDGMFVGFLVWLGFVATTQIGAVIWAKMHFTRFMIHSGCQLLCFLAMGGILGA